MTGERRSNALAAIRVVTFLLYCALAAGTAAAQTLNRGNGGEPRSLDPQFASSVAEGNIVGDMFVGLTTEDAAGRPIPGAADRWTMSSDGRRWSFHIRKAMWSDGAPVTSEDFVFAFERLLDPRTAAPYASNLWLIENARAISAGKLASSRLGVEAPDDATLVIHLAHPASYLPELMLLPAAKPLPRHVLVKGGRVTGEVVNGPYRLREWVPGDHVALVRNPRFYDAANVRIGEVDYYPVEDSGAALRRLRAGELDTINNIPSTEIGWLSANMKGMLHVKPGLALAYVSLNLGDPPLKDARVRRALNLVFDRETVAGKLFRLDEPPAYGYVPPGIAGYPGGASMDFRSLSYSQRVAQARTLMQAAGYGPNRHLRLVYKTSLKPDSKRVATVFQAMARQTYVDLEIVGLDLPTLLSDLHTHQFELAATSWIADFDDASNFLDLLRTGGGNNYGQYSDPKFDALLDAAEMQADAGRRGELLLAAQKTALASYPWIPTRILASEDMVRPEVRGWIDNVRDVYRTRWLWLRK